MPSWPLSTELLRWSPRDRWTLEHACLGSLITGAIGSGKTSGPFQYVIRSFLRAGFGGIFFCAKVDAAKEYLELAAKEGRSKDVIRFRPGDHGFNFLTYEARRPGAGKAIIENILLILMQAAEVASRKHGNRAGDDFFEEAMKQLLRNCLHLVIITTGGVDLGVILEIVQSLPQRRNDLEEPEKFRSLQILAEAERKATPDRAEEIKMARQYITQAWPSLADRTRSSIAITLEVLLDSFMRYPLRDLLLGKTTVSPDDVLAGKLIVIDVAVKEFDLIGKIAGVIWKYSLQRAIERRPGLADQSGGDSLRPIFIAADEAQFWASSSDTLFQTTARNARGLTVYATQNLPNFYAEMGGDGAGKARVDSLLGNLQNRFACQNLEIQTNHWSAESIGKIIVKRKGKSVTHNYQGPDQYSIVARLAGMSRSVNESESEQLDYDVQPRAFTGLLRGGQPNAFTVEAILTSAGERFAFNNERWLKVSFDQRVSGNGSRSWFNQTTPQASITAPRITE